MTTIKSQLLLFMLIECDTSVRAENLIPQFQVRYMKVRIIKLSTVYLSSHRSDRVASRTSSRITSIDDVVRIRNGVITIAREVKVNLADPLVHATDKVGKGTATFTVFCAPPDASQRHDSIIEDKPYVGGVGRSWAGHDLGN